MAVTNVLPLPVDGRQSPTALKVQRGTSRLLRALGFACLPELSLGSGRRADITAVNAKGEVWIIEIKSSAADFRSDMKWPLYRNHCDKLFFAAADDLDHSILPENAGLIVADGYGAEILRDAPLHKLGAAARKAVTLRLARAAAHRMQDIADPDGLLV